MSSRTLAGLSLRDLEYAVAVAECGHFGRAAERCGVSQAGLSVQVRKLEALLGAPLFHRTTRRLIVTPEGELLLRQAREVLESARELLRQAAARRVTGQAARSPHAVPSAVRAVPR
jgi:LysR family hydrogen peroxide-inducible transcriptional activator